MPLEQVARHARTFAGLTLVSRVLGLVRDAVIVRVLGVSSLGTAFSIAFQFPNTFRRLFGEGALSAAFIPEYAQLAKHDPELSHRFASLTMALMSVGLGLLVLVVEAIIWACLALVTIPPEGRRALVLVSIMLPYMPLICVTAGLGGMLQTHARFAAQAGAPIILNLCMIAAALLATHALGLGPWPTAVGVSLSVTIAGFLQAAWCLRDLRGRVRWSRTFDGARPAVARMFRAMTPVVMGLGALQIATLIESWLVLGWPLYVGPTILGHPYPLDESAGAALSAAQRLYQFPLGVFGIALATATFPLLARLADEPRRFAETLRRSLRMALFVGVPATLGLIWVARDLTAVVYQGGRVSPDDVARMSACLVAYSALVGTYSVTHVLTRAFYARGDTRTPTRISVISVASGLMAGVALVFPLRERGLALGSSIAAGAQLAVMAWMAHGRLGDDRSGLFDADTRRGVGRIALASVGMLAALAALRLAWPRPDQPTWQGHALRLLADTALGGLTYLGMAWWLCRSEIHWTLDRRGQGASGAAAVPAEGAGG